MNKTAISIETEDNNTDRWLAGGLPWHDSLPKGFHKDPHRVAALTKAFSDVARNAGGKVTFLSDPYSDKHITPEQAVQYILTQRKATNGEEEVGYRPDYYHMEYPRKARKGLLERMHLKKPGVADSWPSGEHPLDTTLQQFSNKKAAYLAGFIKRASEYGINQVEALSLLKASQDGPAPDPMGHPELRPVNMPPAIRQLPARVQIPANQAYGAPIAPPQPVNPLRGAYQKPAGTGLTPENLAVLAKQPGVRIDNFPAAPQPQAINPRPRIGAGDLNDRMPQQGAKGPGLAGL